MVTQQAGSVPQRDLYMWPSLIVRGVLDRLVLLVLWLVRCESSAECQGRSCRVAPARVSACPGVRLPLQLEGFPDLSQQLCPESATQALDNLQTKFVPVWSTLLLRTASLCTLKGDPEVPVHLGPGFPSFMVFPLFIKSFFMFISLC